MKSNPDIRELFNVLADRDMQAVLMAHDDIARKSFEPLQQPPEETEHHEPPPKQSPPPQQHNHTEEHETAKIVTIRKQPGQPLVSCNY